MGALRGAKGFYVIALFVVLGPLVGYVSMLPWDLLSGEDSLARRLLASPWLLLGVSLYSYLFGGLPALLTGLAAVHLFEDLRAPWFILACGVAGAVATGLVCIAPLLSAPVQMAPLLAIGGVSGLVCGALATPLRNRVEKPRLD